MKSTLFLILIGTLIGAVVTLFMMKQRAHWLAALEFELTPPPVPFSVLQDIQTAEQTSYAKRSRIRRAAEEAQDVLVFASPGLAYRLNFSVGRYRMKAQTIEDLLPWAIDQKYLDLKNIREEDFTHAIAYFSEQPVLNDWQASVYLEWLRQDHPELAAMNWSQIAADPMLVAKLYSGYMGAGGDWKTWRMNLTPGVVALKRLGLY
ncbi:hypothetical protein [uncultured Shimia sp.]|uniref:hypothetical protein n=1 Tax=uncultured Shimia sp. TaxID=573152 RepID=UPI0026185EC7|nr:hypothetical protein [uncultured Shimia sp.]